MKTLIYKQTKNKYFKICFYCSTNKENNHQRNCVFNSIKFNLINQLRQIKF